ncbi:MFS transporter [Nonomuraea soli]
MKTATHAQPRHARTAPTLILFVLTALIVSGQLYLVIPLLPAMADGWGGGAGGLTWLVTAFALGYGAGFLLFGPLSDRYGQRRVLTWGMPLAALATALVAASPGPEAAIALRVLQGLLVAVFPPVGMAYLATRLDPRHRTVALSAVTGAFLASAVLLQIAAQTLNGLIGWRGLFLLSAAGLAAATAALPAVMLPDVPPTRARSIWATYRIMPSLLASRTLGPRYLASLLLLAGFVAVYTGLQLSGVMSSAEELLWLRAAGLPSMILVPLLMPFVRDVRAPRRAVVFLLAAGVALALTGWIMPGTVGLAVLLALYIAAITAGLPSLNESVSEGAGSARGTAIALFSASIAAGGALGPQVAAMFPGFAWLMYGLAALMVTAALAVLATTRTAAPATRP